MPNIKETNSTLVDKDSTTNLTPPPCAPSTWDERQKWTSSIHSYVSSHKLVPPFSMEELRRHARKLTTDSGLIDYLMVLISNELWRETIATIPYDRRLLLLPQCLRQIDECPAEIDEFGLVCEECGRCCIGELQAMAEELNYIVLVAEGSTVVSKLLEGGKVDAVIGVSCLHALEKSFSHMAAEAIPGLAIPLFVDGCTHTEVDIEQVKEAILLKSANEWTNRLDTDQLKTVVGQWFDHALFNPTTKTEEIAYDWLLRDGKRWRPYLLACTYSALNDGITALPDSIRTLGWAVECFHKASLIHDDIEDNDDVRYGEQTLHKQLSLPVALNAGDLLVGEGYRLVASVAENTDKLIKIAAENHRMLCLGQGEELYGMTNGQPFSANDCIEIFRKKTAPAFGVSLQLGAVAAGGKESLCNALKAYSESFGIAYQIRDDLDEFKQEDVTDLRPSLLLALAHDQDTTYPVDFSDTVKLTPALATWMHELMVTDKAQQLLEHYKNEAIRSLNALQNSALKGLLRRITTKMLDGPVQ